MRAICILLTTSVVLGCGDEQATDALMTLASRKRSLRFETAPTIASGAASWGWRC